MAFPTRRALPSGAALYALVAILGCDPVGDAPGAAVDGPGRVVEIDLVTRLEAADVASGSDAEDLCGPGMDARLTSGWSGH